MLTYAYTCTQAHTHTFTHSLSLSLSHTHTHTHTLTLTHTHSHTHAHTHSSTIIMSSGRKKGILLHCIVGEREGMARESARHKIRFVIRCLLQQICRHCVGQVPCDVKIDIFKYMCICIYVYIYTYMNRYHTCVCVCVCQFAATTLSEYPVS